MDREDEKDRFDGTGGTASTKSVQEHPAEDRPVREKKECDMSNRPEKYDTMSVDGTPVFHPTDDSKVPGRIIERKSVKMAVAYHSVISTVKLHGMSCWDYLGKFFKKTVQTSEKKTCFQFFKCSLSYANIFN